MLYNEYITQSIENIKTHKLSSHFKQM